MKRLNKSRVIDKNLRETKKELFGDDTYTLDCEMIGKLSVVDQIRET